MNDVCRKTPTVGKMFAENLKKKLKFSKIYRFVFILSIFARIFKLGIISIATLNDFKLFNHNQSADWSKKVDMPFIISIGHYF